MTARIGSLLSTDGFMPHGFCYMWNPRLVLLHVVSDGLTALAYASIPLTLLYFARQRRNLPFNWMFLCFGLFIVACGSTHVMEIWTLWTPSYWLSGIVKALTAAASVPTAILLIKLVPKALATEQGASLARRRLEESEAERMLLLASEHEARTQAERANRMKDEFLARISHELASPLFASRIWLDVLASGDSSRHLAAVKALRNSERAQSKLIRDLLDTSGAIAGKLRSSLEVCEVAPPLEAAFAAIRPLAVEKGVEMALRKSSTPLVRADPERLQQIFTNVISNAVKFTPPGGRVNVHLEADQEDVIVSVHDTGCGFGPEFEPLLFQPFRQEEEGTTRSSSGLGLGLAIVQQLVESHGGKVTGVSPGRDLGATFTIRLPKLDEKPSEAVDVAGPLHARLEGIRVLLVEDNDMTRSAVTSLLRQNGAKVKPVASAAAALEAVLHQPFDVIVCDIAMPGEDGYSIVRKIRALEGGLGQLPAVALTAHMRDEDCARAISSGFQLHLPKSIDGAQLISELEALLRKSGRASYSPPLPEP